MENAVAKFAEKGDIIHPLVAEMGRVVIKAECRMVVDGRECALSRADVERNFGGMDLQCKTDADLLECIEDRRPAFGEVLVAGLAKSM